MVCTGEKAFIGPADGARLAAHRVKLYQVHQRAAILAQQGGFAAHLARLGDDPHDRLRGDAFAAAGLAHQAQCLAPPHFEADAIHGL
jgi:hypothetical protein